MGRRESGRAQQAAVGGKEGDQVFLASLPARLQISVAVFLHTQPQVLGVPSFLAQILPGSSDTPPPALLPLSAPGEAVGVPQWC